ncbi:hypothetical protein [Halorussus sp. AFM4]|uniref:hypothetical protein n=1 Tax=Halorussus sp. AFM4 TaxID=3421651 RepID=UPI003EBF2663
MVDVQPIIASEFEEAAEARGDDPDDALERLMLEYIRQDSTINELFADDGTPVRALGEYDPNDSRPLAREAIEALPTYAGEVEVDPDDITDEELPQDRELKRHVILGVLRHRQRSVWDDEDRRHESVVRRDDVAAAAESVIGNLDSDYKRDEYVEQVIDDLMIQNPGDKQMVFFSPDEVVDYLESLDCGDHKAENDVYHLSEVLAQQHADDVNIETINEIRREFWFDPL